ncbi:aldo/keto reductase [candidate division KSB1 bacterium]|nr:aldo/keto reductase [candidate division KSB1 bacterium]
METRPFGRTDLQFSAVGFGAWGIGGPAMAGTTPIGWGAVDDRESVRALKTAVDRGINFIDTADFYGLGHSETLIGETFGSNPDILIATKVGHRLNADGSIALDYSGDHILSACEQSLQRLRRERIDYYQLHSAKVSHLQQGECIEAMNRLKEQGKVRYWGLSLSTYNPFPEADFLLQNRVGDGFQLVYNLINQRADALIQRAAAAGYGVIARMPLQFGLLTGKFTRETRFAADDHRRFRLPPQVLERALETLEPVWELADAHGTSKTGLALSFVLANPGVSTVIPGIKTEKQAVENCREPVSLAERELARLKERYAAEWEALLREMEEAG